MMTTLSNAAGEKRAFRLHPSVIKTLIHEQGGSIFKAIAELVMNSIDAGATRVNIEIDHANSFLIVKDDGKGFSTRRQIEECFETFGTPHEADDAQFGRFRIGRGQIMSYARTEWRSGKFSMLVDLEADDTFNGYQLSEHDETLPGCTVTCAIYRHDPYFYDTSLELREILEYVSIPIYVNSELINTPAAERQWKQVDDDAYYSLDRDSICLNVYNCGVLVRSIPASEFGVGGVVVSKRALAVNAARNEIVACPVWRRIRDKISNHYNLQISRASKLTSPEAIKLFRDLIFNTGSVVLTPRNISLIRSLRFLPDAFGTMRSAEDILFGNERFTISDRTHRQVAERIQRENLATVITPELISLCSIDKSESNIRKAVEHLRRILSYKNDLLPSKWLDFKDFVVELKDTHILHEDHQLTPHELAVLTALREVNSYAAHTCKVGTRTLLSGSSDTMAAWTDGASYIAFSRCSLSSAADAPATILATLLHEYSHDMNTRGEHVHDNDFYERFHSRVIGASFGQMVEDMFKAYLRALIKLDVVPHARFGDLIRWTVKRSVRVPTRSGRAQRQRLKVAEKAAAASSEK